MQPIHEWIERLPRNRGHRGSLRVYVYTAVVVLALGIGVVLGLWSKGAEGRAIRRLPGAERGALYRRTLEDLQSVCTPLRTPDLNEHCRHQASFIIQFPECDEGCLKLAKRQLDSATR